MKQTMKVAYGGILAALSVAIMFLSGIIPFATIALPALAGILLVSAVIEMGTGWAVGVFIAVSILSAVLAPDKEAAVMYILLFGYYPIIKKYFERIKPRIVEYLVKFGWFNVMTVSSWLFTFYILGIQEEEILSGWYIPLIMILSNVMFCMYDIALTKLIKIYCVRVSPHLKKLFK